MASPTELDIFNRSLGGDRRARTELYKKYIYGSSRVRRLGAGAQNLNDFLHDCLTNLLRTGHSWDGEDSLAKRTESVAVWTALMAARQHDLHSRSARGEIRMCAEMEGEDATRGEVLPSYAPPSTGVEDYPFSRLLGLLNDTEKAVFRARAKEGLSWAATAAAAGKPVNSVGQVFARVLTRLTRLFGAPPPMDDDLVPVISRTFTDPMRPEGRAISLQLDTAFYVPTPEMHSIGLNTAYDARIVTLWETACQSDPPADSLKHHLEKCHYCGDLLRALLLMNQALACPSGAAFHLCPGAFTLANAADLEREAFDRHLAECGVCRDERNQVLDGQLAPTPADVRGAVESGGPRKKILWVAAAMVALCAASFAGYRYFTPHKTQEVALPLTSETPHETVAVETRYKDLVQDVPINDASVLASVLPAHRVAMKYALDQFSLGQTGDALGISSQFAKQGPDPGAQMIYAMSLFRTGLMTDAYREMLKSEAMSPRDPLRCWVMLQFSLFVGDKAVVEREVQHLAGDKQYKDKAAKILQEVHARG